MRHKPAFYKRIRNIFTYFMLLSLVLTGRAVAYDFFYWDRGANGYESALYGAEIAERPLILYFHIKGNIWCERLNNIYLATEEVENYLMEMYKVEIDPERGEEEKDLSSRYEISQYPAFLVTIPAFGSESERIHPFTKEKDLSVDEFIQTIQARIAHLFSKKAFASFEKKAFDEAIKYNKIAIQYDPENFYAYFALGVVHEKIGVENKSIENFIDAEFNLLRALEIDPNHKEGKAALESVQKNMAILREK